MLHKYNEAKKDRVKSQKDEQLLTNKMKLLSQEEKKVKRKISQEYKNNENAERIRVNVLKNKEMVEEARRLKALYLEEQRIQNNHQRDGIRITLSNWRNELAGKKQNEAVKAKMEKNEIEKIIQMKKIEKENENKKMHDKVKKDYFEKEQKKKKDDYLKKLKMKKELENKIKNELNTKNNIDNSINTYQEKSIQILQRINTIDLDISQISNQTNKKMHHRKNSNSNTSSSTKKKYGY